MELPASPAAPPASSGFLAALGGLRENPLAQREWRGLARQCRDWRLWLGLRLPKDARGWGLPAIAWCALVPYVLWAVVRVLIPKVEQQLRLRGSVLEPAIPDPLLLCYALVGIYVILICAALMATAVSREREQETWESLRTTATSRHEILLGLLVGRIGPPLVGFLLVGLAWLVTLPHSAALLGRYLPIRMDGPALGLLLMEMMALALSAGLFATAVSSLTRRSGAAQVVSQLGAGLLVILAVALTLVNEPLAPFLVTPLAVALGVGSYVAAYRQL